jgi:hypothetical protein
MTPLAIKPIGPVYPSWETTTPNLSAPQKVSAAKDLSPTFLAQASPKLRQLLGHDF